MKTYRWLLSRTATLVGMLTLTLLAATLDRATAADEGKGTTRPLRALMIAGGCCHDYERQKVLIPEGISARARVEWTVVHDKSTEKTHKLSLYEKPNWADGYDVIVHNECYGMVDDRDYIENVVAAHKKGIPAVVIHCSMHTFRALPSDEWREFLGVTSRKHGPQQPLEVKNLMPNDPIMKDFPLTWKTGKEELYAIEKVWPETEVLAQAYALDNKRDHAVIWKHRYGKTRVFGTTLAHHNETMSDTVYLDMLTRGLLWACDKLDDDGKPQAAYRVSSK